MTLAERMLTRLYASSVNSRLLEPNVQVSPSQPWFATCELAGAHQLFVLRWQSCYRTLWQRYPPVTRVGAELTATMELWEAAAKSQPLKIDIYGSGMPDAIWPPHCRLMLFKYSETQL